MLASLIGDDVQLLESLAFRLRRRPLGRRWRTGAMSGMQQVSGAIGPKYKHKRRTEGQWVRADFQLNQGPRREHCFHTGGIAGSSLTSTPVEFVGRRTLLIL
jgi:hypothetical protein